MGHYPQNKWSNIQIKECKKQEFRACSILNKHESDPGPGLRELTVREDLDHMSAFWAGSLSNQPVTPSVMATVTSPERYGDGKDLPKAHSY